ncbi:MAG: D-alanyl-D-alanine carboxypeptidase, partial [Armatimonadetes bacterium CG07_land_8_20_14_0_80_40_9]
MAFIFLFILFLGNEAFSQPALTAQSAILVEAKRGKILFQKNIHQKMSPASITKIMTAILVLEKGNLDDWVITSKRAATREVGESAIWLEEGEEMTLRDLLYALLIKSANDAAVAAAEHISGSVEEFVKLMNKKAKDLGAFETHFSNPHGFYGKEHYSTAYDLSLIARYALKNPYFAQIVKTKKEIIPWEGHPWERVLINRNKLLWRYKWADGVKTGSTKEAGYCLVASATRSNFQLVSVVLKSKKVWADSISLLNYGFKSYQLKNLISKEEEVKTISLPLGKPRKLRLVSADRFEVVQRKDALSSEVEREIKLRKKMKIPIKKEEVMGRLAFKNRGKDLGGVSLIAATDIE